MHAKINVKGGVDVNLAMEHAKSKQFVADLKTDIKTANQIAKNQNICFVDNLKAVYHFRKHGHEFINTIEGSSNNPIIVYLKNVPDHMITNQNLAEVQTIRVSINKQHYFKI